MIVNELGYKLQTMYDNTPNGDKVTLIYLFGIQYADKIKKGNYVQLKSEK